MLNAKAYMALAGLAVLAFGLFATIPTLRDLWLNLGTEIVGILLTVLLVDRVVRNRQESQRRRLARIGMGRLVKPLRRHLGFLATMLKAGSAEGFPPDFKREGFFRALPEGLRFVDFSSDAPRDPPGSWFEHAAEHANDFISHLDSAIETYGLHFSEDAVRKIEALRQSTLIGFLQTVDRVPALDARHGYERPYNILAHASVVAEVQEYVAAVEAVVKMFETEGIAEYGVPDVLWRTDISPQLGQSRLEPTDSPLQIQMGAGPPPDREAT